VPELLRTQDLPIYVQQAEVDFAEALRPFASAIRPVSPGSG